MQQRPAFSERGVESRIDGGGNSKTYIFYSRRSRALPSTSGSINCGKTVRVYSASNGLHGGNGEDMPFPQQTVRAFARANIEAITPGQMGCYGLFIQGRAWVYVGKGDIRKRLLDHLNGDNPCITRNRPTHYVTVVSDDMDALEKILILELRPSCNQKVG